MEFDGWVLALPVLRITDSEDPVSWAVSKRPGGTSDDAVHHDSEGDRRARWGVDESEHIADRPVRFGNRCRPFLDPAVRGLVGRPIPRPGCRSDRARRRVRRGFPRSPSPNTSCISAASSSVIVVKFCGTFTETREVPTRTARSTAGCARNMVASSEIPWCINPELRGDRGHDVDQLHGLGLNSPAGLVGVL